MFSWRVHFYGQCNSDLLHIPLGAFKISSGHVRQRPRIFFSPSQETVRKALIGHHFETPISGNEEKYVIKSGRNKKRQTLAEIDNTA